MKHINAYLSLALFVVAAYWVLSHPVPWYVKGALVVGAYGLMIHWLHQYSPYAARWITSTTLLIIFEMIRGVLSVGSGGRRR